MSETANNLLSISKAKVLLALGEGPWEENIDGTQIFLNGTPLINGEGTENFPDVVWDYRPGTRDQEYIQGIPSVENDISINVELTNDSPWVRGVTDSMLSAVRVRLRWPAVFEQKSNGDIDGYRIDYAIDVSADGGAFETVLTTSVDGKTNTTYERAHRVDLPTGSSWQVRVRRLTANQHLSTIGDTMYVSAITEIVDAKLSYPNTALLYVEYDAKTFDSVPAIAVDKRMRVIQVPSNYDAENRTYSGVWDGSFKYAWTNNPAWVFYDLVINDRFGLGQRITPDLIDKWSLYEIAQYCDDLVPDGKGGTEPRHVCDVYIQQAKEAWQVLRDIAAIYRGMSYWAGGQMVTVADMPADSCYVFNNANVKDGRFSYSGTSVRSKYSRALVSFDNPENDYETDTTSVADNKLQMRYGDNVIELSAIGCARESEAQRRGKWAIYTNNNNRMVAFTSGLDGYIPLPGKVFAVADRLIAGKRIGGRVSAINGNVITLDSESAAAVNDRLQLNLPSGRSEARTIIAVSGRDVEVSTEYSEQPEPEACWALDSDNLAVQYFKCLSIKRADSDSIEFDITGVETNPSKYAAIDNGAKLMERPISSLLSNLQKAPNEVTINQHAYVEQAQSVTVMTISWPVTENAVAYEVQWQKDSGNWVSAGQTGTNQIDIRGVYTGQYLARVRAINANGIQSVYTISVLTDITGANGELDTVQTLTTTSELFGITLNWTFPANAGASQYTEIRYSRNEDGSTPTTLGFFSYPATTYSMIGLSAGTSYLFSARLVDKFGNKSDWSAWVLGQSSTDADALLSYLLGKISETELSDSLLEPIESIEKISLDLEQLNAQVADLMAIPDWDAESGYAANARVRYNGVIYQAKQTVPAGTPLDNTDYWRSIGDYAALSDRVDALALRISDSETTITDTSDEVESLTRRTDYLVAATRALDDESGLSATLDSYDNRAAIRQEALARTTESEAFTQSIETLQARAGDNEAAIQREATARADADSAMAQTITTVQATVGNNSAAIKNEATARANGDSALAQQISTMQAAVGQNSAAIQNEATARASGDSALAQQINTVEAKTDTNSAAVQQVAKAQASTNEQLSAMWKVSLNVTADGKYYAAGFGISIENGDSGLESNFFVLANRFAILDKATGTSNVTTPFVVQNGIVFMNNAMIGTLQNKTIIQRTGGSMQVFGVGFGSSNQFIEWFGPDVGDPSNCTEANATSYKKTNGDQFTGGSFRAGLLQNGYQNTQISPYSVGDYPVSIGPFGTNGKSKLVLLTISAAAPITQLGTHNDGWSPGPLPTPVFGWVLERKIGAGSWSQIASGTITGETTLNKDEIPDTNQFHYFVRSSIDGSYTYTDNSTSTADFSYRVRVTSWTSVYQNVARQSIGIVSKEA